MLHNIRHNKCTSTSCWLINKKRSVCNLLKTNMYCKCCCWKLINVTVVEVVWYQCAFFLNSTFQLKWIMPFITDYLLSNTFELDMNNWIISCTFNDSGRIIFNSSSRKRAQIQGKVALLQTEKPPLGFANLMAWWKGCQLLKMCFCLFEMLCPCHLISCDHDLFFHSLMETVTPRPNLKHIIMIRKIFSWKQNKQTKKKLQSHELTSFLFWLRHNFSWTDQIW